MCENSKFLVQGCGSGCFVNRFRFQHSLDSISSMNLLTSMTIKTAAYDLQRNITS